MGTGNEKIVGRTLAGPKRSEPKIDRAQARRQLEVARKREGILEASARAFARGGYRATTMQDIAREAGYTPPSLYAYFESKEQIFVELAALLSREFLGVFDEVMPSQLTFRERIELLLRRLFEKADRHKEAVTVFLMARLSGEALVSQGMAPASGHDAKFSSLEAFVTWLRKNSKRGELGAHPAEELGVALAGLTQAFCIQWLADGASSPVAALASRVASIFLYGALGDVTSNAKTTPRSRAR